MPDDARLTEMITDRIKWQGDEVLHVAKNFGVNLAWRKAKERLVVQEQIEAKRAAGGEPPAMESSDRTTKMLAYRQRNKSSVGANRPDDKLWDQAAACKPQMFLRLRLSRTTYHGTVSRQSRYDDHVHVVDTRRVADMDEAYGTYATDDG